MWACYRTISLYELKPDDYIFVSFLKACSDIVALDQGKLIHARVIGTGCQLDILVGAHSFKCIPNVEALRMLVESSTNFQTHIW